MRGCLPEEAAPLPPTALGDAFLDVWRTAGRISAGYDVRAWIMVIANRRAVDLVRREQRFRRLTAEAAPPSAGSEDPAEQVHAAHRVRSALGGFPAASGGSSSSRTTVG
jgi:DNA-directed RNA polymerase specialized sigma24 family protein